MSAVRNNSAPAYHGQGAVEVEEFDPLDITRNLDGTRRKSRSIILDNEPIVFSLEERAASSGELPSSTTTLDLRRAVYPVIPPVSPQHPQDQDVGSPSHHDFDGGGGGGSYLPQQATATLAPTPQTLQHAPRHSAMSPQSGLAETLAALPLDWNVPIVIVPPGGIADQQRRSMASMVSPAGYVPRGSVNLATSSDFVPLTQQSTGGRAAVSTSPVGGAPVELHTPSPSPVPSRAHNGRSTHAAAATATAAATVWDEDDIVYIADLYIMEALAGGFVRGIVATTQQALLHDYFVRKAESEQLALHKHVARELLQMAVDECAQQVVRQLLHSLVDDYLGRSKANVGYDILLSEVLAAWLPELAVDGMYASQIEHAAQALLEATLHGCCTKVVNQSIGEVHTAVAKTQREEVEEVIQTKLLDMEIFSRTLHHIGAEGATIIQDKYASRVIDAMVMSMALQKAAEVNKLQARTLDNLPIREVHRKLVYTAGIRAMSVELQEQMDAQLAVQHTQEMQQLEKDDIAALEAHTVNNPTAMDAWLYDV